MSLEPNDEQHGDLVPRPDPSRLTIDAINVAVSRSKEYVNLKIETLEQRLSDMDRATAVLDETVHRTPTEIEREVGHLRELVFAEIEAAKAGVLVAEEEREKAAQALAAEREKAAQALATALAREIESGDHQLKDHIAQQVEQLRGLIESVRREAALVQKASAEAIAVAESLNKERWEGNNKWRDQSADRERSQQEEMAKLSGTFLRQDTADAQFDRLSEKADAQFSELRRSLSELTEKVNRLI